MFVWKATMLATPKPVSDPARRCILESMKVLLKGKTGAFYGQDGAVL